MGETKGWSYILGVNISYMEKTAKILWAKIKSTNVNRRAPKAAKKNHAAPNGTRIV